MFCMKCGTSSGNGMYCAKHQLEMLGALPEQAKVASADKPDFGQLASSFIGWLTGEGMSLPQSEDDAIQRPANDNAVPRTIEAVGTSVSEEGQAFCEECGKSLRATAKFCKGCGAKVES